MDSTKHTYKITPEFDEIIYIRRNFPEGLDRSSENNVDRNIEDLEDEEKEQEIERRKRIKNIEKQHRYKVIY